MLRGVTPVATLLALLALALPTAASAASGSSDEITVVVAGDVDVDRDETVGGVYVLDGDVRIAGKVDGSVVVLNGDVLVSGTILGDLFTGTGEARLLPSAEVTGDLGYSEEHPDVALDARVRGEISEQGTPDAGGLLAWLGGFVIWLAVGVSSLILGVLLLLIAPRAADSLHRRSQERLGPVVAIGIAILIALPIGAVLAGVTVLGLPLAAGILLAMAPLAAVAYVVAAWALGRRIVKPPRERILAFLVGLAILRIADLVPFLGLLVGIGAVVVGLGLIGAAIGAARESGEESSPPIPG